MAANRIWIMDGHNMIFAIPALHRFQVTDRREEARSGLADRLERFALTRGEKVLVVFDGNALPWSPDAGRTPLFETVYARRGEGVADDRILHEARRCLERGLVVTVVTDDVSTLARELPRGVRHLGVQAFWLKYIEKEVVEGGKRVEGDFSDVEREMMTRAAVTEPVTARTGRGAAASDRGTRARASGEEATHERIRRKREKGRLRHERLLKRRAKPARRR
jgi:predicted RNA-binding protein with PIN domain